MNAAPVQAPAVAATAPAPAGKVTTTDPAAIVALLQKKGYRAKLVAEPGKRPYIDSASNGASFGLYFQNCDEGGTCEDAMFQSSYKKKKDKPIGLDAINAFNRDQRWARAYLDKEGDPTIEQDLLFTNRMMDAEMFDEALEIWDTSMGEFHDAIGW